MPNENRATPIRDECRIEAALRMSNAGDPVDCLIENISEEGAKLRLPAGLVPPSQFKLLLPLFEDHCYERQVQLRWQVETEAGVRFVAVAAASYDGAPKPLSPLQA